MNRLALIVFGVAAGFAPAAASAQTPPPGALACAGCHPPGDGAAMALPSLNARSKSAIIDEMIAFRDGARAGTVMPRIAKGFTEAETEAIAVWFSQQAQRP